MHEDPVRKSWPLALAMTAGLLGCASGPTPDVSGRWEGSWAPSSGSSASVTIEAKDSDGTVSGTVGMTGGSLTMSGETLVGTYSRETQKWTGSMSSPDGLVTYDLTVDGEKASGTLATRSHGSGSLTLQRSSSSSTTGGCEDDGKSCESDPQVTRWKGACDGYSQAPCYCGGAATYACFLKKGCYREANPVHPTQVTKNDLQSGCSENQSSAAQLGTNCGVSCN